MMNFNKRFDDLDKKMDQGFDDGDRHLEVLLGQQARSDEDPGKLKVDSSIHGEVIEDTSSEDQPHTLESNTRFE